MSINIQSKLQEVRSANADKKFSSFAEKNFPEAQTIGKGNFDAGQTLVSGFFNEGGVKSVSRDGLEANNFVNLNIPTVQTAHAVHETLHQLYEGGEIGFRRNKESGNIEYFGDNKEADIRAQHSSGELVSVNAKEAEKTIMKVWKHTAENNLSLEGHIKFLESQTTK